MMETTVFEGLYKQICGTRVKDFPSTALSGLLHGYLSVYSMVRVHPWLEDTYDTQWVIYDRVREIAGRLSGLAQDVTLPIEERVGHVADLMDTYLLYSDMESVNIALDIAYAILSPEGSEGIVLLCRTPEMCRMLCSCYYFTSEEVCVELVGEVLREQAQNVLCRSKNEAWAWHRAVEYYRNTVGENMEWPDAIFENHDTADETSSLDSLTREFYRLSVSLSPREETRN